MHTYPEAIQERVPSLKAKVVDARQEQRFPIQPNDLSVLRGQFAG
jgi:hypothetical protein